MGRRRALVLALVLGVAAFGVATPTLFGRLATPPTALDRLGRHERVTITRDNAVVTAELPSFDSHTSSSDARRFDLPWAALAAAAILVAACQWLSAHRRRHRVAAPLTTRAPARAPPLVTAFASAL